MYCIQRMEDYVIIFQFCLKEYHLVDTFFMSKNLMVNLYKRIVSVY